MTGLHPCSRCQGSLTILDPGFDALDYKCWFIRCRRYSTHHRSIPASEVSKWHRLVTDWFPHMAERHGPTDGQITVWTLAALPIETKHKVMTATQCGYSEVLPRGARCYKWLGAVNAKKRCCYEGGILGRVDEEYVPKLCKLYQLHSPSGTRWNIYWAMLVYIRAYPQTPHSKSPP